MLGSETVKLLEEISAKFKDKNQNEVWRRYWLEKQAREQGEILRCPKCDAFVPIRLDSFDSDGKRTCLLCGIKFFPEEQE